MIKGVSYRDNPLERRIMETFYINVPKANGTKKIDKVEEFIKSLPFVLTEDQIKCIEEIKLFLYCLLQ